MNSLACTLTLMAFSFSLNIFCSFSFLKSFFCFSQPIIGQLKIEDLVRWKQKKFGIRKHNLNGVEKIKIRNTWECCLQFWFLLGSNSKNRFAQNHSTATKRKRKLAKFKKWNLKKVILLSWNFVPIFLSLTTK